MKYIVEISEKPCDAQSDDNNDYVYCSLRDLDENIFQIIDCEDIVNWIPIGSTEFIKRFTDNFLNKND